MVLAMAELGRPCGGGWCLPRPVSQRSMVGTIAAHRKDSVTTSRKTKLHRTWNPGRRVSSAKKYEVPIRDAVLKRDHSPEEPLGEHSEAEHSEDETDSESETDLEDEVEIENAAVEQPIFELPVSELAAAAELEAEPVRRSQLNCLHFSRCSGCTFENNLNNPPVFKEVAAYFQQRHVENFRLVPSAVRGWRCRAKLAVRGTVQEPLIGLFEGQSHNVVSIPECQAHHPVINAAVKHIKDVMMKLGVQPYDEQTSSGQLRYIQVIANTYITSLPAEKRYANARVQVSLVWNSRNEKSPGADLLNEMAQSLWKQGGDRSPDHILHSVWANFQTTQTNIILGQRWRHLYGEEELWERVGGVDICYTPSSFGQANYQAFENLLRALQKYVRKGSAVADLYAGVGVMGLSLAATRNCRIVKCVEVNKHCRSSFERALERFPKSRNCQISWHCADATEAPVTWLEGTDVVIVDPPRKGLEPSVIEALRTASLRAQGRTRSPSLKENNKLEMRPWILRAKQEASQTGAPSQAEDVDGLWPESLIYVSCSWEAFQKDCEALEYGGLWHLQHAQGFNFFPGTNSMELLAVFKVGKRTKEDKRKAKKAALKPTSRRRKPS